MARLPQASCCACQSARFDLGSNEHLPAVTTRLFRTKTVHCRCGTTDDAVHRKLRQLCSTDAHGLPQTFTKPEHFNSACRFCHPGGTQPAARLCENGPSDHYFRSCCRPFEISVAAQLGLACSPPPLLRRHSPRQNLITALLIE